MSAISNTGTHFPLQAHLHSDDLTTIYHSNARIQSSSYEIGLYMQGASVAETTYLSLVCSVLFDLGLISYLFSSLLVDSLLLLSTLL
jgi:hypothetical protein